MILEFSVENYRSFMKRHTFSMLIDEGKLEEANNFVTISDKYRVLRSAVIFGANASGKSNLMKAFQMLRNLIINSADQAPDESLKEYDPFQFHSQTTTAPTAFEIDFLLDKVRYNYFVRILKENVVDEHLLFYPEGRESRLFKRSGQNFEFGDYLKGQKVVVSQLTAPNQLFLSKAARNNVKQLVKVYQFFTQEYMPIPFLDSWVDNYYVDRIAKELVKTKENALFIENFKLLLKSFDTGIQDFRIKEADIFLSKRNYEITVEHDLFNDKGDQVGSSFFPIEEESTGTQKLFVIGGLILRALMNGRTIFIDEFERSLHPLISSYLIQLFNDPEINTTGAQLIIATHDTNLLSSNNLRRDQVWIVEKDNIGASDLFSLSDVIGIKKGAPYEKWYLSGRMGGIPGIKSLGFELNFKAHEEK